MPLNENSTAMASQAAAGGADPVTAIANAVGAIFGTFGQIGATRQSAQQGKDALLLASAPKRPQKSNVELWFFVGMMLLLVFVIVFKLFF